MSGDVPPPGAAAGDGRFARSRASDADRDGLVEILSAAIRDGRLTAEEFAERVETALSSRTLGELAALKADLPIGAGTGVDALPEPVKEVIRIDQRGGSISRTGRWVVPRRLEMRPSWCHVTLDFTSAVITRAALLVEMKMRGGSLVLVVGDGMSVEADSLKVRYTKVEIPGLVHDAPGGFRVTPAGRMRYGLVEVRSDEGDG